MNGVFSVLGSTLVIISMAVGFTMALTGAALLYRAAGWLTPALWQARLVTAADERAYPQVLEPEESR